MRQFLQFFLFWVIFIASYKVFADCVNVYLENASESFALQLAAQLENEEGIQLVPSHAISRNSCAVITVRLIDDVAVIGSENSNIKPTLLDLSPIDPAHWARTVALTCATLFVENAPEKPPLVAKENLTETGKAAIHDASILDERAENSRSTEIKKKTTDAKNDVAAHSAASPKTGRQKSEKRSPKTRLRGISASVGGKWISTYKKEGLGPLLQLGVFRRFRLATPFFSMLLTHHSASTRTNDDGLQMWGAGVDAAVWRIHSVSSRVNFWWGGSLEFLWIKSKGNDASYAHAHSHTSAVISALGHLKSELIVVPSTRLCATFFVGWPLRSLEIQVADKTTLGVSKLLMGLTAGIIWSW